MRKYIAWMLAAVLLLSSGIAYAAQVIDEYYSDAHATSTHENIIDINAWAMTGERPRPEFRLTEMMPTQLNVETIKDIFEFVEINHRPPARYFPEVTQQEIDELARMKGTDMDSLHMSEYMSMMPQVYKDEKVPVEVDVHLDIDYEVGRIVIVVLGWLNEKLELEWKALDANVLVRDTINFTIPQEVLEKIHGRETLFAVLTVKEGGGEAGENGSIDPYYIPSKEAEDMTGTGDAFSQDGEQLDCRIMLVNHSRLTEQEMDALTRHILEEKRSVMSFFDMEINRQVGLMLPEVEDLNTLVAYEAHCTMVEDYKEPYGDVMAQFTFVTPYHEKQQMVALIGIENEQKPGTILWNPLRAEYKDGLIEITFSATVLPAMMEEPALLLLLSTPLELAEE